MARSTGNFKSCRITVLIKESITAGACCCTPVDFVCVCVHAHACVCAWMWLWGWFFYSLGEERTAGQENDAGGGRGVGKRWR